MKNHCVFDNLTLFKYYVGLQQKVSTMTEDGTMSEARMMKEDKRRGLLHSFL